MVKADDLRPRNAIIRLKTLAWATLTLFAAIGAPLLWSASPWLLVMAFIVGAVAGLLVGWIWRKARRATRPRPTAASAVIGGLLTICAVAAPLYWLILQPALHPLAVPRVTLSDGKRQLVFQGMVHVGSDQFYRSVAYDMVRARDAGFVLFFEGALPGTPEAEAWLRRAVQSHGELNEEYAQIGNVCGLRFQGDFLDFLQRDEKLNPQRSVAADVSVTEMFDEWKRLVAERPDLANALPPEEVGETGESGLSSLMTLLSNLGERQRAFVAAMCRGVFSVVLNRAESGDVLNLVILDFRNRKLADRIADAEGQNIYVVYGSGHFPGLFKEMRARDPAWRVLAVTWSTAIEPPDDAVGRLDITGAQVGDTNGSSASGPSAGL